jgi:peptidyl-prolyl cis-trans isomerase SurA
MTRKIGFAIMILTLSACSRPSADTKDLAARVNGHAISRLQVDKYFHARAQNPDAKLTGVAEQLAKMEILRDMIDRELMTQKAEKLKISVGDSDVELQEKQLRGSASPEDFKKELERRGITEKDMRDEIRQTLIVQKVTQEQVDSKIQITDAEIHQFYDENRDTFNVKEPMYHLAQIVVKANAFRAGRQSAE